MSDKDRALEILRELVMTRGAGTRGVVRTLRLYEAATLLLERIDKKKAARGKKNATD